MNSDILLGLQSKDEGKGKIVTHTQNMMVARFR